MSATRIVLSPGVPVRAPDCPFKKARSCISCEYQEAGYYRDSPVENLLVYVSTCAKTGNTHVYV